MEGALHLEAHNVSRFYGRTVALRRLSLAIGEGESVLVLGMNGAGKSTLLAVLAGVLRPDTGRMEYRPQAIAPKAQRRIWRKECAYVPAGVGLYADLSVEENLLLWAVARRADRAPVEVAAVIERLRLGPFRARRIRECSTGVARRATLGTAFLGARSLIVLDEPLAHLDEESRAAVFSLLGEERERRTTLVIAAHEPELMEPLATRSITLLDGTISENRFAA